MAKVVRIQALMTQHVPTLTPVGLSYCVRTKNPRRKPWDVVAQKVRLHLIATDANLRIDKVWTLLDARQLSAPPSSAIAAAHQQASVMVPNAYEIKVGDLYAGDVIHLPVLLSGMTTLEQATELLRVSLSYVDVAQADAKTVELCASVPSTPGPGPPADPLIIDRERLRVLAMEELLKASEAANASAVETAIGVLDAAVSLVGISPATVSGDALACQLLEELCAAQRLLQAQRGDAQVSAAAQQHAADASGGVARTSSYHLQEPGSPTSSPSSSPLPSSASPTASPHIHTGEPGRTPLKPRTFSVALPLSPPRTRSAPDTHPDAPLSPSTCFNPSMSTATQSADSPIAAHYHQPASSASSSSAAAAGAQPRAGDHHRAAVSCSSSSSGDWGELSVPSSSGARSTSGHGVSPLSPSSSARPLGGSVPFGASKAPGRTGGHLSRSRSRPLPHLLLPLRSPHRAAPGDPTSALAHPQLAITSPLSRPAAAAVSSSSSSSSSSQPSASPKEAEGTPFERWLGRLLGEPPQRRPRLPDEVIAHIFSFVEPAVLFRPSLELPTIIVDKTSMVRGHHTTITSALRAARPGERILVRPGVYRESLLIERAVCIVGCVAPASKGGGNGVVITSSRNHTVHSMAPFARMQSVTLRQTGSSGRSCLLCSSGTLEVSSVDISSSSGLCVEVSDSAMPIVRNSRIHSGSAAGFWFRCSAGGLVEGNEIFGNGWSGVQISDGSNPTLLRNFIHDNKSAGVISFNYGRGIARHNDITSNGKGGVQVRSRACPEFSSNRIFAEHSFGVWVYEHGLGHFEDNDIVRNAWSGFQVEEGSAPLVIGNRLRGNRSAGIVVYNRGAGIYEWNDISANGRCGVQIKSGSAPLFRFNRIYKEKQAGVLTAEDGTGMLEENDIFDNAWSGVQTEGPSSPMLRRNRIHHNGGAGFIAYQNGSGVLEGNSIYSNKKFGVQSKTGGHPTVRMNTIHDRTYGIYLTESGAGSFEENSLHGAGIFVSPDCAPVMANNNVNV